MKKRRILSWVLLICVLCTTVVWAEEPEKANYAEIFFDGSQENVNITNSFYWGGGTNVTRDGVSTAALGDGNTNYYGIDIKDTLFSQDEQTPVAITVQYFDEGEGYFSIDYVKMKDAASLVNPAGRAVMTDTKTWKEYTFHIDDILFCDSAYLGNVDMRIATWTGAYKFSQDPVYIRSIKIEKAFPAVPISVSVTSKQIGNIFDDEDDKFLNVELKNISEVEFEVNLSTRLLKYDGAAFSDYETHSVTIQPKSIETVSIQAPQNLPFGLYYLETEVEAKGTYKGEEKVCKISEKYDFSVANKRDADEPGNSMIRSMFHTARIGSGLQPLALLNLMGEAGITGLRDEILFSQTGASSGIVETPYHQKDICFPELYANNQKNNMLILFYDRGGVRDYPKTATEIEEYTKYVAGVVKQNAEYFDYYEIWNEPNLEVFAATRTGTAYADVVKLTAPIIRENDPTAKICIFGTAQIPLDYMKEAMDEGVLDYADIVTVHPYDWNGNGHGAEYGFRNDYYVERMKELRQVLTDYGRPDMPIISSELGIRSGGNKPYTSQIGQAANMLQIYALTAGEELSEAIYQYAFIDFSLQGADDVWGFVRNWYWPVPHAAKPAYLMISNFNKLLTNATPTGSIKNENKTSAYKFRSGDNDKDIIVLWSEKGTDSIALNLGTSNIQILDMYGNVKANLSDADGIYDFHATFEPQYIIGNFTEFEETEPSITIDNGRIGIPIDDRTIITVEDKQKRNLDAKIYTSNNLELVGQTEFTDGKASFEFYTKPEAIEENEIIFEFYEGDRLVYYTKAHILIREALEVVTDVQRHDDVSENRYKALVGVKNLADTNEIRGKITIDYSEIMGDVEGSTDVRSFDTVKPGETVYVEFNVPTQIIKRTVSAKATVELDSGIRQEVPIQLSRNASAYMSKPPKMTGPVDYSEWSGGDWCAADDKYAARYSTYWDGPEDCSLRYKIKWDEENIYILGLVTDNIHYSEAEVAYMWRADSIQMTFSSIEDGKVSDQYTEFFIGNSTDGLVIYRNSTQGLFNNAVVDLPVNVIVENAEITFEPQDGKYVYRARIPWSEIFGGIEKMEPNTDVAISTLLNDNDGAGRRGWVEYSSGIGNGKYPTMFGVTTLIK